MSRRIHTLNFNSFTKTLINSNTLEPLCDTRLFTYEFELFCSPTNTGNIAIGESEDNTWIPRTPGSKVGYKAEDIPAESEHFDLNTVRIRGTAGDSVIVQYRMKA